MKGRKSMMENLTDGQVTIKWQSLDDWEARFI